MKRKSLAKKRVYGYNITRTAPENVPRWMKENIMDNPADNPADNPVDSTDSEQEC